MRYTIKQRYNQFIESTQYPPMKPAVLKVLASFLLFISAASCKKSDTDSGAQTKSTTTLLTQTSWKIQTVGLDADKNGVADSDVTSSVPACKLDNVYTFRSDSTGTMDEGAVKCNTTDPQTSSFTWGFKNNQTVLTGTFGFSNGDASIISITDTVMIVTYDDNLGTATTYHFIVTLKH
jgi:hypothetical protein